MTTNTTPSTNLTTSSRHETFTIERDLKARPAIVFAAWSKPEQKRRWFVDSDAPGWVTREYALDFRVGGWERGCFVLESGPGAGEHRNATVYLDIADAERIVYAYTMAKDGRVHSASLCTVTFEGHEGGTRMRYVEQGTFLGDSDGAAGRKQGWESLLSHLERTLG